MIIGKGAGLLLILLNNISNIMNPTLVIPKKLKIKRNLLFCWTPNILEAKSTDYITNNRTVIVPALFSLRFFIKHKRLLVQSNIVFIQRRWHKSVV